MQRPLQQQGESHTLNHFTLFLSCLIYFSFSLFLLLQNFKTPNKISVVFIPVLLFYFIILSSTENTKLCDFSSTNNNDLICSPIAPPATDDGVDGGESSYVSLVRSPLPQLCQNTLDTLKGK